MSDPADVLDDVFEKNMSPAEVSACYRVFCKMVLYTIRNGRVDRAERALEKIIGEDPVSDFRMAKADIKDFGLH
jgi:hypothetical protein